MPKAFNPRFYLELGGLAQLGERLHGMQEVIGSIPLSSTLKARESKWFAGFFHARTLSAAPLSRTASASPQHLR